MVSAFTVREFGPIMVVCRAVRAILNRQGGVAIITRTAEVLDILRQRLTAKP